MFILTYFFLSLLEIFINQSICCLVEGESFMISPYNLVKGMVLSILDHDIPEPTRQAPCPGKVPTSVNMAS